MQRFLNVKENYSNNSASKIVIIRKLAQQTLTGVFETHYTLHTSDNVPN